MVIDNVFQLVPYLAKKGCLGKSRISRNYSIHTDAKSVSFRSVKLDRRKFESGSLPIIRFFHAFQLKLYYLF